MKNILRLIKRILSEKYPLRFVVSRVFLYAGIDLPFVLTFDQTLSVRTYLHASSAAHKLFIGRYVPTLDIAVFKKYIEPQSTVFDVGANIGMFSAVAARLAPQGVVYAFEATPKTFQYLTENVRLNKIENIYPVYGAVCNQSGFVSFFEHAQSHEQNYIATKETGTNTVPAVRLGAFADMVQVSKIDFLKIDVEGAELSVLESMGDMLKNTAVIYFEYTNSERYQYQPEDIFAFLKTYGFSIMAPKLIDGVLEVVPYDSSSVGGLNLLAVKL